MSGPLTVTVTTGIITCLVGDPYKPSFATVAGRGPHPKDMTVHGSGIHEKKHATSCAHITLDSGHVRAMSEKTKNTVDVYL